MKGLVMRMRWPSLVVCLLSVVLPASAMFAADPPARSEVTETTKAEIARLIRQLAHDDFDQREEASQALVKLGPAAREALEAAKKSDDREVATRAGMILLDQRKRYEERALVCVVGLYESRRAPAIVEVTDTTQPIILVLCAYENVTWQVKAAEGVDILRVIASGYHQQRVEGVTAPVETFSYDERSVRPGFGDSFYFYTYDHDEEKYPKMVAMVQHLTGKKPGWFQGRYGFKGTPFVIASEKPTRGE